MYDYVSVTTADADSPTPVRDGTIKLHDAAGFDGMRKAGRLSAEILDALVPFVQPGVTTAAIDDLVRTMMLDGGGIPDDKPLREGDIVNIDVTSIVDGWHGDTSRMYLVGDVPIKAKRLVEVTYECLMLGIEQAKPGNRMGDVAHAIQTHAERHRYSVVRDFCGHGLGQMFHDAPEVVHAGRPGTGPELRPGMFFTIEPMINTGKYAVKMLNDGWTAVTRDRSLSAQFEHSIGITEDGCEIFTASPTGLNAPPWA